MPSKSIAELQEQIRGLSDKISETAEGFCRQLNELRCDLSALDAKPSTQMSFDKWKKQGAERPLTNPLLREKSVLPRYFTLLCALAQSASGSEEAWLLLHRIAAGCGHKLKEGAKISVRGLGKFIYDGIENESRKGRLFVKIRKYV